MNISLLINTGWCQFYSREAADSKMSVAYVNICFYVLNKDYCDIFNNTRRAAKDWFIQATFSVTCTLSEMYPSQTVVLKY